MRPWLELLFGCVIGPIAIGVIASAFVILSAPQVQAAQCPHGTVLASWYGRESCHRTPCRTADGTHFDGSQMVAASLSLPLEAIVRVTLGSRSVVVRIADRGPAAWTHRAIDLSRSAAFKLGMIGAGTACVTAQRLR